MNSRKPRSKYEIQQFFLDNKHRANRGLIRVWKFEAKNAIQKLFSDNGHE